MDTADRKPHSRPPLLSQGGVAVQYPFLALGALVAALAVLGVAMATKPPVAGDITLYQQYAASMAHQSWTTGLPQEYPALAGVWFLAGHYLPLPYPLAFSAMMAGVFLTLIWAGTRAFGEGWALRVAAYTSLAAFWVFLARYDLVPALTILLAVRSARDQRWRSAWAWAVLGGLFKLVPFLLLPGFFLMERRRTGRWPWPRLLQAGTVVGLLAALQQLMAPGTLLHPLHYESARGFEYSSLSGSLSLVLSPGSATWASAFHNVEIFGGPQHLISLLIPALAATAIAGVWLTGYRRNLPIEVTSLTVLSLVILANKSFAPQYLLWLIPLWAMSPLRWPVVAVCALTTVVFPLLFLVSPEIQAPQMYLATSVAGLRNAVLAVATVAWYLRHARSQSTAETAPAEAPITQATSTDLKERIPCLAIS